MTTEPISGQFPIVFRVVVEGCYTTTPDLAEASVTKVDWHSENPKKRRAELLALRSAFGDWYYRAMREFGGDPRPGSPEALDYHQ